MRYYTDGETRVYKDDEGFREWLDERYPDGWRYNGHEDNPYWNGGYYDALVDGVWRDTRFYYTEGF